MNKTVCWISAGVSSFIAGYLMRHDIDEFYYIHINDQHPDSLRFIRDAEHALGKEIVILQSRYKSVNEVLSAFRFLSQRRAICTDVLKRRVRKEWESHNSDYAITYVWGMDSTEKQRAERLMETMPQYEHAFPLIEKMLTKEDAHAMCSKLGIKRPAMYDMGYRNNNCIGCLKGGMGYWNKIRKDFPDVFLSRAKQEREIGHSIFTANGKSMFLDELPIDSGMEKEPIMQECSILCEMALDDIRLGGKNEDTDIHIR